MAFSDLQRPSSTALKDLRQWRADQQLEHTLECKFLQEVEELQDDLVAPLLPKGSKGPIVGLVERCLWLAIAKVNSKVPLDCHKIWKAKIS